MIESEPRVSDNDIAIVGISVRFPQINTLEEFRRALQEGRQCISSCPESRKADIDDYLNYCDVDPNKQVYRKAGYFEEIDKFDYRFFNISPKEAVLMDPIQRMLLETSFHALEDAGFTKRMLNKKKVGVFTGFPTEYSSKVYHNLIVETNQKLESSLFSGNLPAILPSRLSYFLDLRGPAAVIDTSCSSSLSALYFASQSIVAGDCEMAVVNGVNIFVYPILNDTVGTIGILSSDGKTKAFDESADGVGQGEGVVAIVIKNLQNAIKDQDNIYAVIKAVAINQDGKSIGITAPNQAAQTEVIIQAWDKAKINPETISYIETHGTGTKLGDPTEISAINNAFRQYTSKCQICAIGSVKTNLGHTLGAAGLAGIVKTAMQLYYGELYPICNFNVPNRRIDFLNSKIYINTSYKKWVNEGIRRAGVSSFGITGTNCHVVMEEYCDTFNKDDKVNENLIFVVSARDKSAFTDYLHKYNDYFCKNKNLDFRRVCYSSCMRKDVYAYRAIIVSNCIDDLVQKISKLLNGYQEFSGVYLSPNFFDESCEKCEPINTQNRLSSICRRLAMEQDVDLSMVFNDKTYKHLPLPGYPFKKERVWIKIFKKRKLLTTELRRAIWNETAYPTKILNYKTLVISQGVDNKNLKENFQKHCLCAGFLVVSDNNYFSEIEQQLQTKSVKQIVCILNNVSNEIYIQQINSLLEFVKICDRTCEENIRLIVVLRKAVKISNDEEINPYTSLVIGVLKTIIWECSKIIPRCIDVDLFDSEYWVKEVNRHIPEFIICYRGDKRYSEYIEKINTKMLKSEGVFLRKKGIYVIIGGNGRIGRKVANYLSECEEIKLIILCRTDEEANRIHWDSVELSVDRELFNKYAEFKEIEKKAHTLDFKVVDISDALQVERVFSDIVKEYGSISGVIQAAVDDNGVEIKNLSLEILEKSIKSKVQGTMNIAYALEKVRNLDFLVLFSTVMTLISAPGNATYTMANYFLDSVQKYLNDLGINTFTINWPEWRDIDLNIKLMIDEDKSIFKKITPVDAMECLRFVIENKFPQVYVGQLNDDSILWKHIDTLPFQLYDEKHSTLNYKQNIECPKRQPIQVKLLGRKTNDYTISEVLLAELYSEFLGYNEVDINENFFNLGGDSIFAMKIAAQLQDSGIEIEGVDIMRYQNIMEIAKFIDSKSEGDEYNVYG